MYAKLVTNAAAITTGEYFNALIGVITGTVTNINQLPATTFNQGASEIISTVSPGWSVHDNAAATAILAGVTPVVIKAPWSDDATKYKYIWVGQVNSTAGSVNIHFNPAEGWNATTHTATSIYAAPPTTTQTSRAVFYAGVAYMLAPSAGFVTVISASANHLFVWTSNDLLGTFNSYVFCSEYSRDDPWNTVANGYPSWFLEGNTGTGLALSTGAAGGTAIRTYDSRSNADVNHLIMGVAGTLSATSYIWALAGRYRPAGNPSFRGLGAANNTTNSALATPVIRDGSKNISYAMSEIRMIWNQDTAYIDTTGPYLFGSVSAKSPYIYLISRVWASLDEIDISGTRYTNLVCNNSAYTSTAASTVAVKKV